MARLPENVRASCARATLSVATTAEDGTPNIAIKGSGALLDDEHLYFAELFSKKTAANLLQNMAMAVAIYEPDDDVAVQVKGEATLAVGRGRWTKVGAIEAPAAPHIKSVIRMSVTTRVGSERRAERGRAVTN